jgi:hypothetical protein
VYYAAHAALAAGDERLAEAAGLFGRTQQRAHEAVEAIQVCAKNETVRVKPVEHSQADRQEADGMQAK